MTANHCATEAWVRGPRKRVGTVGLRQMLTLVFVSFGLVNCVRTPQSNQSDVASAMIPPNALVLKDLGWLIETWSARKIYTFESQLTESEYRAWAKRSIGPDWHCRIENGRVLLFTRLGPTEQQTLELRSEEADPGRIRVRVTFIAMPT